MAISKLTALFLFFLLPVLCSSQEGLPVYHDYLSDNWYLIHPAMAGAGQGGKVRLTARKQWFDAKRAPNLQTLNAHMRISDRSGAGIILLNDENGYHSQTGIKLTYAHHLRFSRDLIDLHQLSFGLNVGLLQSRLDESEFMSLVPDPIVSGGNLQSTYYNVDLGLSYHFLEFFFHVTLKNLLGTGRDLYTVEEIDNLRRYLVTSGYVFGKNSWQYEPSVLFQYADYTRESMADLNFKVYKQLTGITLWGGMSYRTSLESGSKAALNAATYGQGLDLLTALAGFNYGNFMFSYTYSYQTGDAIFDAGGFHQITLGYDFLKGKQPYDCKCPAVNY
ncbi:type IX secretion system membrane protein PorP/SprF [Robertkochia marina]|uniref:Type IX secretion system membrane protein PorP/SprF n=1 Tax=Robertkochia marina TaxID=1227945 RepID=A0A4S3M376_9FLAO|nr:type IX secretion system membrane protein PorP/SprF [Robertkochia marina]THD69594.1 type IX secretion system membrane protein PorP/SprF [Robertkochia marina]TRZ47151.1 type IX secretion system membrane protein PorP/SprF [Robertkochia marina]